MINSLTMSGYPGTDGWRCRLGSRVQEHPLNPWGSFASYTPRIRKWKHGAETKALTHRSQRLQRWEWRSDLIIPLSDGQAHKGTLCCSLASWLFLFFWGHLVNWDYQRGWFWLRSRSSVVGKTREGFLRPLKTHGTPAQFAALDAAGPVFVSLVLSLFWLCPP